LFKKGRNAPDVKRKEKLRESKGYSEVKGRLSIK